MIATLPSTLLLTGWDRPACLPEGQVGRYRIRYRRQPKGVYYLHGQYGGKEFFEATTSYHTTRLQEQRGKCWFDWMTDDPLYWHSMASIAGQCKGRVLVIGLGLGLVLRHLKQNAAVVSVDVVEISPEVCYLTWPHLRLDGRFRLLLGDFFDFARRAGGDYDCVVADLWVGSSASPKVVALFNRTWDVVNGYWPNAEQFYHGLQPWHEQRKVARDFRQLAEVLRYALEPVFEVMRCAFY